MKEVYVLYGTIVFIPRSRYAKLINDCSEIVIFTGSGRHGLDRGIRMMVVLYFDLASNHMKGNTCE